MLSIKCANCYVHISYSVYVYNNRRYTLQTLFKMNVPQCDEYAIALKQHLMHIPLMVMKILIR